MEALRQVLLALAGALLTTATAWFLGSWALERLRVRLAGLEGLVFAYGAGMALLSLTVFLLAALQALYAPVLLALFPLSAWLWRGTKTDPGEPEIEALPALFWIVAIPFGALYLIHALAPEITSDGAGYHLELIQRYLREHGFSAGATNIYAQLSQGSEMLYLFAYSVGGDSAAKLAHLDLLGATVVAMLAFGRRFGLQSAAWAAALLYAVSPIVGRDATSTYNDCALAFFAFLAFYAARLLVADPSGGRAVLAGGLAGMCFAVKYTGFPALVVGAALILAERRARNRSTLALFSAAAALFVLPWLIKNAVVTGNPVAPLFNAIFPNPYATPEWEAHYRQGLRHFNGFGSAGFTDYLRAPWELAVGGTRLGGLLGPAILLVPLALFDYRRRTTRLLLGVGLLFALPWLQNAGARFWIPALPFLSLAAATGCMRLPFGRVLLTGIVATQAILCWPQAIEQWRPGVWKLPTPAPWREVFGLADRQSYLRRYVDGYDVAQALNHLPEPGLVFSLEALPEAYIDREVWISHQSALGERLTEALWAAQAEDWFPGQSLVVSIPRRPITAVRMTQTDEHPDSWILSEVRFWNGDQQVFPSPEWRWKPPASPWEADRAHDNNPFTRWKSWRRVRPGMRFDVEFGRPLDLTSFEFVYPLAANWTYNLTFEARAEDGQWSPLPPFSEATQRFHKVDPAAYRRWAVDELRRAGVALLLLSVGGDGWNRMAAGIDQDPAAWGLKEVASVGPRRIYRLPQ